MMLLRAMPVGRRRTVERGFTVALLGPDGAGKSTVSVHLPGILERRARHIYMGINLEVSNLLLPTTRLVLEAKRALGRRPDLAPAKAEEPAAASSDGKRPPTARLKTVLYVANLIAEEWFRQGVIRWYLRRGEVVVLDRHFLFDYYDSDVAPNGRIPAVRRLHGYLLREIYPRPDLAIVLDAPGAVLYARKGEGSIENLERRRHRYVRLLDEVATSAVVDATQPIEDVLAEVTRIVEEYARQRSGELERAGREDEACRTGPLTMRGRHPRRLPAGPISQRRVYRR